jgi:hypothetical protein
MSPEATELLIIGDTLRYVLYGVCVVLRIDMRASEIERLFNASASGDSTAQSYEFHRSAHVVVTGRVDEYEPGSVWLSVAAAKFDEAELKRLVEAARQASFGLATARRAT